MSLQLMESTVNQLRMHVFNHMPLPQSGDFTMSKRGFLCDELFKKLDQDWVKENSLKSRHLGPAVDSRQNQQRYARQTHRATEFLDDCDSGYMRQVLEPNESNLRSFFIRRKWEIKEDLRKVNFKFTLTYWILFST